MPITLYVMERCGFCVKAKKMFAPEIASGEIVLIDSSQAPKQFKGFPTFTNGSNHHSGLPHSKQALYDKLKYSKESYSSGHHLKQPDSTIGVL